MKDRKDCELETLGLMIGIYCRAKHRDPSACPSCQELLAYAAERLCLCPKKPRSACRDCRVHCYSPDMRGRIKDVMRYSGPRVWLYHPWLALRHLLGF